MSDNTELSKEKIAEYESKMRTYYEEQLPFLRIKHEYDTKMAEIAEARIRAIRAQDAFIQYQLAQQETEEKAKKEQETHGSNQD